MAILFANDLAPKYYIAYNGREGYFTVSWKENDQWVKKEGALRIENFRLKNARITEKTFEGKTNEYLTLTGDIDGERAVITFNLATKHAARVAALLLSANLAQPVGFACTVTKAGTTFTGSDGQPVTLREDVKNVALVQNGSFVRMKETPPPAFIDVEVRVGKKVEVRSEPNPERIEYVKNAVEQLINTAIRGAEEQTAEAKPEEAASEFDPFSGHVETANLAEDDIPF